MMANPSKPSSLAYVDKYISFGWVLVLLNKKVPIEKGWQNRTENDIDHLKYMLKTNPDLGVGLVTGKISNVVVLDVDPRNGGNESLTQLEKEYEKLPKTLTSITGGGGKHVFFQAPDVPLSSRCGFFPGLDAKGERGQVVLPPSSHPNGTLYRWMEEPTKDAISPIPVWLHELMMSKAKIEPKGESDGKIPEGSRNSHLTSLAGAMRRKGMGLNAIEQALLRENEEKCSPPLDEREVKSIVKSCAKYPEASKLVEPPLTEAGNAERLAHSVGNLVRYRADRKKWMVSGKNVWRQDDSGLVFEHVISLARLLKNLAKQNTDASVEKAFIKNARSLETYRTMASVLKLAQPLLEVDASVFDANPRCLNVENGYFSLDEEVLKPHSPDQYSTMLSPVIFDPTASCPQWIKFLRTIMNEDEEMILYLQRAVGYSISGETGEQCIFVLHGNGANGKTTFLQTIQKMLGSYGRSADINTFLEQKYQTIRNDLARLRGVRFVVSSETSASKRLDENLVKVITGGEKVAARFLYAEHSEFEPKLKLWMSVNQKPKILSGDHGIWRRIHLVPFEVTIPESEIDFDLGSKLEAELSGILNWAIEGYRAWKKTTLNPPVKVLAAKEQYRQEQDRFAEFIEESCIVGSEKTIKKTEIYRRYRIWAEDNGEKVHSQKDFSNYLKSRGFEEKRTSRERLWQGIGLKNDGNDGF